MKIIRYSLLSKTAIRYNFENKSYVKTSYDKEGILNIKNEYDGYNWYISKKKKNSDYVFKHLKLISKKGFAKIEIPEIKGFKVPAEREIYKNEFFILSAINEYFDVSKQNNFNFRFHGDFSIGNIIFNEANAFIIDWEHSNNKINIWGVDVLNLFFESLYFSFKKKNSLNKKNLQSAKRIYNYINLIFSESNNKILRLNELIEIYKKNKGLWGLSFSKLPILKFNKIQIEFIEKIESKKF